MTQEIQKPAEGIMRTNREEQCYDTFKVECDCGTRDHAIDFHVSIDRDTEDKNWVYVNTEFFVTMYTPYDGYNFFPALWLRLKRCAKYLFTGYIDLEHTIMMRDEVAKNFGTALIEAVDRQTFRMSTKKDK